MSRRKSDPLPGNTNRSPARTPHERETQIASLAFDLVEKRLREGNASSQETVWALRLGSSREHLEQEKLEMENKLLQTKREMMESEKRVEALYLEALNAMRSYSGNSPSADESEYDELED